MRHAPECAGFGPGLLRVTTPGYGDRGYHGTYHRMKVHPDTLKRLLRAAHATMTPDEFGKIVAGAGALAEKMEADE